MNKSYKPAVIYRTITTAFWFISPILPKVSWVMSSFVEISSTVLLFVYVRYLRVLENLKKEKKQVENTSNPKSLIAVVVSVVIVLWFGIGVFPIRPVAIATGSMENTLMVGDVAILKKCTSDEIEIGDIIQYQKDDFTVIHRVISKYYEDGKCYLITKGDNNQVADYNPVAEEQIIAKQLFSVRFLGLPAVWLNNSGILKTPDTSSIEKGV
jgi:signal peptidase